MVPKSGYFGSKRGKKEGLGIVFTKKDPPPGVPSSQLFLGDAPAQTFAQRNGPRGLNCAEYETKASPHQSGDYRQWGIGKPGAQQLCIIDSARSI